ncbi:LOW QUALITY PROTEIN: hypothetical protein TorRG33x02_192730 [Trema orientale]|uniref:RNase H type-1 domain-containing protein n=1 Tax=Trema orientale TaxID=63057 RepID=A0A2P5EH56_TREOI|nr:LOW QUALITY PROTEIN: hypothetical protein TorRG33x02_192730 [Trema orientale]
MVIWDDVGMVRGAKALKSLSKMLTHPNTKTARGIRKRDGRFTPLIVELMAILEGLLFAIECRCHIFAMENDSINAIAIVNSTCVSSSN